MKNIQTDKISVQKRGRFGERLVECYINDELIPSLKKKEGWTDIIYTQAWYRVRYSSEYFRLGVQNQIGYGKKTELESFIKSSIKHEEEKEERWRSSPESIESSIRLNDRLWEEFEARILITSGFYPTKGFLKHFKKLTASLFNRPDGFLIKMKRTETYRTTNEAIKKYLSATNDYIKATIEAMKGYDLTAKDEFINHFGWGKLHEDKMLPVVNGKIEVAEVKTGKGNALQIQSYRNAAANGYPLRLFHVDLNSFVIKEKLIVNPDEIISDCFKDDKNTTCYKWK